jgi:cysteine desulfurase
MIYLDNNATTPLDAEVREAMLPFLDGHFANPSSGYGLARPVRRAVAVAREQVAELLDCDPEEIVFTSGGTESDNAAILSARRLFPERDHFVTCAAEHDAVTRCLRELEERDGCRVTRLGTRRDGTIDLGELQSVLVPGRTALVCLMQANNETGVVQPVAEAAAMAESCGALFHTDAVQAAGKVPIRLRGGHVHTLALSGHKFHAPKGVGVLYVNRRIAFAPMLTGGGQEGGRRAGTENVAGIVAIGMAAACGRRHLEQVAAGHDPVAALRDEFEREVGARLAGVTVNGAGAERTPNTSSLRVAGVEAAAMMVLLDQRGVCVSAGSACHTGTHAISPVLAAMGLGAPEARETLRVSLSRLTTAAEIREAVDAFVWAAGRVREVMGQGPR